MPTQPTKPKPSRRAPSKTAPPPAAPDTRTGLSAGALQQALIENLRCQLGRIPATATRHDWYVALAYTVRDRLLDRYLKTVESLAHRRDDKLVAYLSAEFLPGPHLGNGLLSLGILEEARRAVAAAGQRLEDLLEAEEEPGLGNGGLGRLAACFMDSLATLNVPAIGFGIRYEFGIFDQVIRGGEQVEITDKWLRYGNPWEVPRPEISYDIRLGGRTEAGTGDDGAYRVRWIPARVLRGVAYDTPIPGYRSPMTLQLRLWKAEACESFDFQSFNVGDYLEAVEEKIRSETVSKVLYPNDEPVAGKYLRLAQQYFFVSCSLQDMIRIHLARRRPLEAFHESWAVQLNDTHPAIAVAEMMRLLVDEHGFGWDAAWAVVRKTFAYTNHTLLPEALERWPYDLFASVLPRHLEIILEINRRFLDEVRAARPGDEDLARRLSLIDETGGRHVRMAHLACVGSHTVNGVAALHSELLGKTVLADFHGLEPGKFVNVTNGVTPRRWIALSNPGLAALVSGRIGDGWVRRLEEEIRRLEPLAEDAGFREEWRRVKKDNKAVLAAWIRAHAGVTVDPETMFDVQVKRIHEYKRQHLNVLHVVTLYDRLRRNRNATAAPRTVVFGGKAAPGYFLAKRIIRLIHAVAGVINADPAVRDRLKVAFLPDFNVKNAQAVYPAADLSEQISTAGKEASGTGNMKFAMNGALTIGTLDGANIEIFEAVGESNGFPFGLTADQVRETKARGYDPAAVAAADPELRQALEMIGSGFFSDGDRELFRPIVDSLLQRDEYLLLADYRAYVECQEEVGRTWEDREEWTRRSILNTARTGNFSSDRSIREYCSRIWNVRPLEL